MAPHHVFAHRFFAEGAHMILGARAVASFGPWLAAVLTVTVFLGVLDAFPEDQPGKVLILPFQISPGRHEDDLRAFAEHVNKRLRSAVEQLNDKYTVQTRQVVDNLLKEKSWPENDAEAQELAVQTGSDYVLYGYLAEEKGTYSIRAVMWDLRRSRQAVSTEMKVGNIHGLPQILELFVAAVGKRLYGGALPTFYKSEPLSTASTEPQRRLPFRHDLPQNSGPWRSPAIAAELWGLAVGDLLGDRKNELVLLDEGGLSISRLENAELKPLTQFSRAPARFLAAEVADLDGDGIDELILCTLTPQGIGSTIVKYKNREFQILQTLPHTIVRTVSDPDSGKPRLVVGQRTDSPDIFTGEMVRFALQDGQLTPDGTMMLPPGTFLLSYADGEMGKEKGFLRIILNQDQKLMVYDRENRLLFEATDRIYGLERGTVGPLNAGGKRIFFPGKLMITDTSGAGQNELLVVKQSRGASAIHALVWDGAQLEEKWKTIASRGIISDFTVQDLKNEGVRSLALILVEPSPFPALTRSRSIVFAYDLVP
jgi:hypothetical protein